MKGKEFLTDQWKVARCDGYCDGETHSMCFRFGQGKIALPGKPVGRVVVCCVCGEKKIELVLGIYIRLYNVTREVVEMYQEHKFYCLKHNGFDMPKTRFTTSPSPYYKESCIHSGIVLQSCPSGTFILKGDERWREGREQERLMVEGSRAIFTMV